MFLENKPGSARGALTPCRILDKTLASRSLSHETGQQGVWDGFCFVGLTLLFRLSDQLTHKLGALPRRESKERWGNKSCQLLPSRIHGTLIPPLLLCKECSAPRCDWGEGAVMGRLLVRVRLAHTCLLKRDSKISCLVGKEVKSLNALLQTFPCSWAFL